VAPFTYEEHGGEEQDLYPQEIWEGCGDDDGRSSIPEAAARVNTLRYVLAYSAKYKLRHDGAYVYRQHATALCVWERICEVAEFLDHLFRNKAPDMRINQLHSRGTYDYLLRGVLGRDRCNPELPFLVRDPHCRAFANGMVLVPAKRGDALVFEPYFGALRAKDAWPVACVAFLDQEFDPDLLTCPLEDLDVPVVDQILAAQGIVGDVRSLFYACSGRLLFRVNAHEEWKMLTHLYGKTAVGKSTVMKCLYNMFPREGIASITAATSVSFPYETVVGRSVLMLEEVPPNIANIVKNTDLQIMIDGAPGLKVNLKGGKERVMPEWEMPIMMASNAPLPYADGEAAMMRRVVQFSFMTVVRDTTPVTKICGAGDPAAWVGKNAAAKLLATLVRHYLTATKKYQSIPATWGNAYVDEARAEISQDKMPLLKFLLEYVDGGVGPTLYPGKTKTIAVEVGVHNTITIKELEDHFYAWLKMQDLSAKKADSVIKPTDQALDNFAAIRGVAVSRAKGKNCTVCKKPYATERDGDVTAAGGWCVAGTHQKRNSGGDVRLVRGFTIRDVAPQV